MDEEKRRVKKEHLDDSREEGEVTEDQDEAQSPPRPRYESDSDRNDSPDRMNHTNNDTAKEDVSMGDGRGEVET